jgi:hypothetical protein
MPQTINNERPGWSDRCGLQDLCHARPERLGVYDNRVARGLAMLVRKQFGSA